MSKTRIKFCGLTRVVEVEWACALGVDAIGLVFYPKSPRAVTAEQAVTLLDGIAPFVTVTGLFMNPTRQEVEAVLQRVQLDLLQFHGEESAEFCEAFNRPYIKAVPMGGAAADERRVAAYVESYPAARGFLLDSNAVGKAGGTGETFDWQRVPVVDKPVILAGGIGVENVAHAIKITRPFAVDVSSGIERIKGEKARDLMQQFVQEVRIVDQQFQ